MHKCFFCNKYYKSTVNLRKHYIKCSMKHNVNILNCQDELFTMLKGLVKVNEDLTCRVRKLETLTYKEKKKVDVLDWLNKNKGNCVLYSRFLNNIEICVDDLNQVFEVGIIDGLINIINNKLENMCEKPLMCFERKSYVLYVNNEEGWEKLSEEEFKKGICYLQREILKYFRMQNPMESIITDKEHNIYNKRLMSICVDNFSSKIKNIRNEIYRINKINIDKIIKYDFIF